MLWNVILLFNLYYSALKKKLVQVLMAGIFTLSHTKIFLL